MNVLEYRNLLFNDYFKYILVNSRKFTYIIIDLVKQKLQEDVEFAGFSNHGLGCTFYLRYQFDNNILITKITIHFRDIANIVAAFLMTHCVDSPLGNSQDDYDMIFCLVSLHSILPENDTFFLKGMV